MCKVPRLTAEVMDPVFVFKEVLGWRVRGSTMSGQPGRRKGSNGNTSDIILPLLLFLASVRNL